MSKVYLPIRVIAAGLGVSKKTAQRRCVRERWQRRRQGRRIEFQIPAGIARLCETPAPSILYQPTRIRELKRGAAVLGFILEMERQPERGIERALIETAAKFQHLISFSTTALRRWIAAVERGGVAALQEQRLGRVGRKAARLEKILR